MKILLANKFFFPFGGTESAFFNSASMLRELGHQICYFSMEHPLNLPADGPTAFAPRVDFDSVRGPGEKARATARALFGFQACASLERFLAREKPDIAHLHNVYHHLSPMLVKVLKRHGIPTVMTLHDYKPVCPAYKLYIRGEICERCRKGRFHWAFLKKCVKESRLKSLVCYVEALLQKNTYLEFDAFVAPSRFLMNKIAEMGFKGRCFHIPNAVPESFSSNERGRPKERRVVFFGRLAEEKGVKLLVQAMSGLDAECLVIGDGPQKQKLMEQVHADGLKNVIFTGRQSAGKLAALLDSAALSVCPSTWYENNPFAIIESFARGVPVVAAAIGGIPELVLDGKSGLLFQAGDSLDLREKILMLLNDRELGPRLAAGAKKHLADHFSPAAHASSLLDLYGRLLKTGNLSGRTNL